MFTCFKSHYGTVFKNIHDRIQLYQTLHIFSIQSLKKTASKGPYFMTVLMEQIFFSGGRGPCIYQSLFSSDVQPTNQRIGTNSYTCMISVLISCLFLPRLPICLSITNTFLSFTLDIFIIIPKTSLSKC